MQFALMTGMDILDSWTPTVESIENLPLGLRRYIHELQTNNDLAGTGRISGFTKRTLRFRKSARGSWGLPEWHSGA
jgi:hypothetical protein